PDGHPPAALTPGVLLTGPFPLDNDAARRMWRFRFGGRSRLEFVVRGADDGQRAGAIQADLVGRYDLTPGQMACAFEYDLKPARGPVTEWAFTFDPGLRVTDVAVNNRDRWWVDGNRVHVALREPGAGGKMLVTAVGPLADPARGPNPPLPMVRPVGAGVDAERVE